MLDLKDLWIGDCLRIISQNKIVKFHGLEGNLALVKYGIEILRIPASDLEYYEMETEAEIEEDIEPSQANDPLDFHLFPTNLDLHYEALKKDHPNLKPLNILKFQIEKFESYLEQAIEKGVGVVNIIHGKGEGILRDEIISRLSQKEEVKFYLSFNGDGSTQVHLK